MSDDLQLPELLDQMRATVALIEAEFKARFIVPESVLLSDKGASTTYWLSWGKIANEFHLIVEEREGTKVNWRSPLNNVSLELRMMAPTQLRTLQTRLEDRMKLEAAYAASSLRTARAFLESLKGEA